MNGFRSTRNPFGVLADAAPGVTGQPGIAPDGNDDQYARTQEREAEIAERERGVVSFAVDR